MSTNIGMIRVETKLKEMFLGQLDISNVDNTTSDNKQFETRSLAAIALMMKSGIDVSSSCLHITDGYHDMGIDAIYLDETQKKLFIVQSKWRSSGQGSVTQEEMHSFVEGIKRIINFDIEGANPKIQAKKWTLNLLLKQFGIRFMHCLFTQVILK